MEETMQAVITIVVQRKDGAAVADAMLRAGAAGVTYYYARGSGMRQKLGFWGRLIEGEKQVVLAAAPEYAAEKILNSVIAETGLDQPGQLFAYIQPASRVFGSLADN
ncbi:MAG: hypothetical protein PHP45_03725 [Elusimicrobiales bacterium]|nr:hypothetical protein [Elusimicrobiales bacterium]